MTIDAANFEPQGKPTPAQVKAIYDQLHVDGEPPALRKLHTEVTKRGFKISLASIQRYVKTEFRDRVTPGSSKPVTEKKATQDAINKVVKDATTMKRMPDAPEQTPLQAAVSPPIDAEQLEEAQLLRRIWRMRDLMNLSEPQIQEIESKIRRAYNVILLEESIFIADKLACVPKDSAMMVKEQAEAGKATVFVPDTTQPLPPGVRMDPRDPRVIDNEPAAPANPLQGAIANFLKKEGIAA